jgi:hypothetical protein
MVGFRVVILRSLVVFPNSLNLSLPSLNKKFWDPQARKTLQKCDLSITLTTRLVVLGGVMDFVLATGPKVRGFRPGRE